MKKIKISELPQSNSIQGLFTIGTDSQNRSVKVPLGEVINDEIRKVKRTYNYSRIDALSETSSSEAVAMALTAEGENKPTNVPTVGDILVDWSGVTRVPVVRQSVKTGGEKPIYSFSYRTADNTATKTVTIQGYLYEPQTVVGVETVKDVTQQQVTSLDTQLTEEATARLNQDDVLEAKITDETTARTNADTALDKRIDAEQKTREDTDTRLFERIVSADNAIKAETTARTSADKVLTDNLAKEVADRTKAITAEQTAREQADKTLQGNIDALKATATDKKNGLMSKSDKATLDALPKKITDEATARADADTAINTDIQGIKDKGSLHDLFLASGATYNDKTKMYQLNGLDLTFEEMRSCFYHTYPIYYSDNWLDICNSRWFKTNVKRVSHLGTFQPINFEAAFVYCQILIKVDLFLGSNYFKARRASIAFSGCYKLESIKGIDFSNSVNKDDLANTFYECRNLKDLEIKGIANDVSFACSPLLTQKSVLNIIKTATPNRPITITLHPTAYAMATADPEIQAELEKQPNISLAEGQPSE